MSRVALVLVAHVRAAAEGVARIAGQMAPDVRIVPAGGTSDDGIGTDVGLVQESMADADQASGGAGVVVLTDLGSAVLTAETVLELLEDEAAGRVVLADAPFVEGAVAAAVAAQQGEDRGGVRRAAEAAGRLFAQPGHPQGEDGPGGLSDGDQPADDGGDVRPARDGQDGQDGQAVERRVTLRNPLGLHARPAAVVARLVADQGVPVTVDGRDASSVLELMAMGATGGQEITVRATGPGAGQAVDAVVGLVEGGFGET